jgi:hypothetical protein
MKKRKKSIKSVKCFTFASIFGATPTNSYRKICSLSELKWVVRMHFCAHKRTCFICLYKGYRPVQINNGTVAWSTVLSHDVNSPVTWTAALSHDRQRWNTIDRAVTSCRQCCRMTLKALSHQGWHCCMIDSAVAWRQQHCHINNGTVAW